jgi:hypothetical protein
MCLCVDRYVNFNAFVGSMENVNLGLGEHSA